MKYAGYGLRCKNRREKPHMPKNHEKFHSFNGKRLVLVVDDEMINRAMLGEILKSEYEVIYAADGQEALAKIREYKDTLSLVLLDILMPVMSGTEVLKAVKAEPDLARIPIIVITSEQAAEVESLKLGAIDFIPKPYPAVDVILARVLRTIELSEDRDIIQSTERDSLTGLYNREYFYRYCEQYDQYHRETVMDAVIVDVNHFHMINERYGKAYGDDVLKRIGERVRDMVRDAGGIVCRRAADTFMVYCPHRDDYEAILENASIGLAGDTSSNNRVRLRMGVYSGCDKSIDIERRFDRAKMAADAVKGSFTRTIGFYDDRLHERELYAEQLIEEFPKAIAEDQFLVYYQPKFDVRPDTPVLISAEALVRWQHPDLGLISPGVFIPLFEDNGLIQRLDLHVWRKAAQQIRDWKDRLGYSVPVSVNVSRIDMYDPNLVKSIQEIISDYQLTNDDLILEVTESAYTEDSGQIIEVVNELRSRGFRIEMDDFGTGYSSLNMISTLPIDALKLDMYFIRNAFREGGNTHMLEVIIEIAGFLAVQVVAEGVETEEQLNALKTLGCDIVQGYFFSKPVPAADFEAFILQKKEADKYGPQKEAPDSETLINAAQMDAALTEKEAEEQPAAPNAAAAVKEGIQLRTTSIVFAVLAFLSAIALLCSDLSVTRGYQRMAEASDRYIAARQAAADMERGSDYLTDKVRCFVETGDTVYLDEFYEEVYETKTRDRAVEDLAELLGGESQALDKLNTALMLSNDLVATENLAMRLTVEAGSYDRSRLPADVMKTELPADYLAMTPEEMRETARQLVFNGSYMHSKDRIRANVAACTDDLILSSSTELERASEQLSMLVRVQTVLTVLFLLMVLAILIIINTQIRRPLTRMVEQMQRQEVIPVSGMEELRYVTETYNKILLENKAARERLSHAASHDALTGLFNRGAYDMLMESVDKDHMALILVDVDHFKTINDTYGHEVGDRMLKRVAEILRHSFRSVDIICRFGGDEFVVIMTRVNSSMKQLVINKMNKANELLQNPKDDLPPASISVGVAFADRPNPQGDIFVDADTALYQVKSAGRSGCKVYE